MSADMGVTTKCLPAHVCMTACLYAWVCNAACLRARVCAAALRVFKRGATTVCLRVWVVWLHAQVCTTTCLCEGLCAVISYRNVVLLRIRGVLLPSMPFGASIRT